MHSRYREAQAGILARAGESVIHPTLDRMRAAMDLLGHPQSNYRVIHVTGTNGKTSTARMIDGLLRERQLRVGRYTSPHLTSMRERIVIDGEPISEEAFVDLYADVLPYVRMVDEGSDVPMSFFEVLTVMAYAAFADAPVDVAVVEVGMGGTWDATNVVEADVAVVTPVSVDHTRYLSDTVEGIAEEKAGIIKPGSVAVLAQQTLPAAQTLLRRAAEVGAEVAREGLEFGVLHRDLAVGGQQIAVKGLRSGYDGIFLPMFGAHQASNAAVALAAVEAFAVPSDREEGLDPDLVRTAMAKASSPGRLEIVRTSPTVLVDSAHNPAGMTATVEAVRESFTFDRLVGVVAVLADKDVEGILEPLEPLLGEVVVTANSSPRAMPPRELREIAEEVFGADRVHLAARLDDAIDQAVTLAERDAQFGGAGVLVTGSVVTAGDATHLMKRE
ncbi:bifunctional folylpolyglutamate synthase/dihydrofolate synthase [Thermobifida halotolerans]|uniref:Dihydrofolate synthase/folylpolyglutamate synthase n=1 Tax=Thermobifida halotolerans TaxID=483545 RepID=A0A399G153_9ACTN|nr:folylpolyglutamate synthase/dihydrofolate synthase family protein [Thermobifida halotolerans]UOE17902.1 bifunctional folylpolyglutamate synthase/dihydrofolate synthase [Thermobifida halotolerans]